MKANRMIRSRSLLLAILFSLPACKDAGPSAIVNLEPSVRITSVAPDRISGTVCNMDTSKMNLILWAKTDQWYVQPWIDKPFTVISRDGSWESYIHPWTRVLAILASKKYAPGATRMFHPALDPEIIAWDEYPSKRPDRLIEFSGYRWIVKSADLAGPGPNYFSDDPANVWVAADGLHLKINYTKTLWRCAEVVADHSLGYGTYTIQLASRVDSLDIQTVAAGFIYAADGQEVDIEWSRMLAGPHNMQYVVQPWDYPGNNTRFMMPAEKYSTHQFVWCRDSIVFTSWVGLGAYPPSVGSLIRTWTYQGPNIPTPGEEQMRFNLWLLRGIPPAGGQGDEMIVRSFHYQP